jgi:hypothetical protein
VRAIGIELLAPGEAADFEPAACFEACPTSFAQQSPGWRDAVPADQRGGTRVSMSFTT